MSFERLYEIQKELALLKAMNALLDYDQQTEMPKAAIMQRAATKQYVSTRAHEIMISDELNNLVNELDSPELEFKERKMIDVLKKEIKKSRALPTEFVQELSHHESVAFAAWEEAKQTNSFDKFSKELDKMIELKKKQANYINPNEHPYNVLLDDFEEGTTFQEIQAVFEKLKSGLIELLKKIESSEKYKQQKDLLPEINFPEEGQRKIVHDIIKRMLLEEERSVLGISTHPFTTGITKDDIRLTTAFREGKPMFSFGSTVHEAGHALYELGYNKDFENTILFDAPSLGIHESQSRFWELFIGHDKKFWEGYYEVYKKEFPDLNLSWEEFYEQVNLVKQGLVRIESDEIHYCLHVIIRFEIEIGLFEGKIKTEDLPEVWNSKYEEYIGVRPHDYSEGVLQDVHWSGGYFGYFPTYAIGTMYAAMLCNQMRKEVPDYDEKVKSLDFKEILTFLREKVHIHGRTMLTPEIIEKATGKHLEPDEFLEYLNNKYSEIYRF